jgi:hypothetical protein
MAFKYMQCKSYVTAFLHKYGTLTHEEWKLMQYCIKSVYIQNWEVKAAHKHQTKLETFNLTLSIPSLCRNWKDLLLSL